jgi:hypothetical protein
MADQSEPVAWAYELAYTVIEGRYYDRWYKEISYFKPCVPEGSIRNLRPLYAHPAPKED